MWRRLGYASSLIFLVACSTDKHALMNEPATSPGAALASGIDTQYEDPDVRPQDDLYRYLNGKWLDTFQLPPDKGDYGAFSHIDDQAQEQLRAIVDGLSSGAAQDADAQKL